MSLFLGKIHYWLFNKIQWFEGLERDVIVLAKNSGLDVDTLTKEINAKYGEPTPNKPLEDMIDTGNIHGWLQGKIHAAEGRMAAWTNALLSTNNKEVKKALENIYIEQGIKAGKEVIAETKLDSAEEIYNAVNDYILDGMPCDRVNVIEESNSEIVSFRRSMCVHKEVWEREDVNVDTFYGLRKLWVESFIQTINDEFEYVEENGVMSIRRK
ncbi:hypothetical protein SAMN04487886_10326 [Clostridium sp. DSM 8431]|uniref:hypothetical protein n=1 Tax=Clostridium sp. DSM 8431 TaxID=1761781 RepID=UPI0008E1F5C1|nr:hypothetical protein [Clostridium sp. DSM 8431]SFU45595.1 hypothetical protein SAMN04487886_10326 [Clostridium sp. DSM 8431]